MSFFVLAVFLGCVPCSFAQSGSQVTIRFDDPAWNIDSLVLRSADKKIKEYFAAQKLPGSLVTITALKNHYMPLLHRSSEGNVQGGATLVIDSIVGNIRSAAEGEEYRRTLVTSVYGLFFRGDQPLGERVLMIDTADLGVSPLLEGEVYGTHGLVVYTNPQESESFWTSTVEPVLVVLGGAAIVALFFLIRS